MYVYQEYAGSCGKDSMKVANLKESGPDVLVIKKDIIVSGVITGSPAMESGQSLGQPSQSQGSQVSSLSSLAP